MLKSTASALRFKSKEMKTYSCFTMMTIMFPVQAMVIFMIMTGAVHGFMNDFLGVVITLKTL